MILELLFPLSMCDVFCKVWERLCSGKSWERSFVVRAKSGSTLLVLCRSVEHKMFEDEGLLFILLPSG